jgi:hypothetical protein
MKRTTLAFLFALVGPWSNEAALNYPVVASQARCYDNRGEIPPPKPGQPFYGQDAQFHTHPASIHAECRPPHRARQCHRSDLAAQPRNRTVKVLPLPNSVVTLMVPPWASTMALVMARPSPVCPAALERALSAR